MKQSRHGQWSMRAVPPLYSIPSLRVMHKSASCRFDEACRFEAASETSPNISLAAYPGQRAQCQKNGLFPTLT